jgi:hypothetical protein
MCVAAAIGYSNRRQHLRRESIKTYETGQQLEIRRWQFSFLSPPLFYGYMQVDTASASESQHRSDAAMQQLKEQIFHMVQSDDAEGLVDVLLRHYQQQEHEINEIIVVHGAQHDPDLMKHYALTRDKAQNPLFHYFKKNYQLCVGAPRIMAAGLRLVPWSNIGVQNHTDLIRLYNRPYETGTEPPEWLSCLAQLLQTNLYEADVLDSAGHTLCARALVMGDVRLFEAAFQAVAHPRPMAELQQLLDLSRQRPNTAVAHTLLCHYPSLAMCYEPALVYPYNFIECKHVTQYLQVAGARYRDVFCKCAQSDMPALAWIIFKFKTQLPRFMYCDQCAGRLKEEDRITAPLKRDSYMAVAPADVQRLIMGYAINCKVHTVKLY